MTPHAHPHLPARVPIRAATDPAHAFDDRVRRALAQVRRDGSGLALVVVQAPPCCLDAVATMVRDSDVSARRGDGRFAVLLLAPTVADVRRAGAIVADRLQARVRAFTAHGDPFPQATVTVAGAGDDVPQALLERAGLAHSPALA